VALLVLAAGAAAGLARKPFALGLFCCGAFAFACVGQELVVGMRARRALTGESPGLALMSLVARNRRRYGGYAVHVGVAVLLVGVAASTTFQHVRDVRLRPGQSTSVGGYDIRYVRPTAALSAQKITLGAVLDVSRHGRHVTTLIPSRGYYPSLDQASLGRIGPFFNGDSTSELGLRPSLTRDIWTAAQPELSRVQPLIRDANRRFPNANSRLEGLVVGSIVQGYMRNAAIVDFRLIVSPLVAWIWIGGMIVVGGAMILLWPTPRRARRRVPKAVGRSAGRARAAA
jgi:cytochrome c-type biogenesis protein CcmF